MPPEACAGQGTHLDMQIREGQPVMTTRSIGAILGLGLVGSLVLAGCGSGGSGSGSTTPAAASGSASTSTSTSSGGAQTGSAAAGGAGVEKVDGAYTMLKLPFNEQVFAVSGQASPTPAFDQSGMGLDPSDPVWPKAAGEATVPNSQVKVYYAGVKGKTGLNFGPEAGNVTVNADGKAHKTMYLVAGAGNGPGTADITFNYADGSKDTAQATIDDWCSNSPTGGAAAWTPADRMDANGAQTGPACGVFLVTVKIPSSTKPLKNIVFANDSANGQKFEPNILAITLQ